MYNEELKMDIPTMVSIREAAEKTGLSYDYLRRGCIKNEIVHIRCGKKILINMEKLIKMMNQEPEDEEPEQTPEAGDDYDQPDRGDNYPHSGRDGYYGRPGRDDYYDRSVRRGYDRDPDRDDYYRHDRDEYYRPSDRKEKKKSGYAR